MSEDDQADLTVAYLAGFREGEKAAAERIKGLETALGPFASGAEIFYASEPDDCVVSMGRWKYQEDGRARFYADVQVTAADIRRARAAIRKETP